MRDPSSTEPLTRLGLQEIARAFNARHQVLSIEVVALPDLIGTAMVINRSEGSVRLVPVFRITIAADGAAEYAVAPTTGERLRPDEAAMVDEVLGHLGLPG